MKRVFVLILAMLMIFTLFTACEKKQTENDTPDTSKAPSESPAGNTPDEFEEITEINFWMFDRGNTGAGALAADVEAAVNEITVREIGVEINFKWVPFSDYNTQLTLAIANNEAIDLAMYNPLTRFVNLYSTGTMKDITELLPAEAPELAALVGEEILRTSSVDGRIYGIPNYRVMNSNFYIIYRLDMLERVGMKDAFYNMQTWSDFEEILKAVSEDGSMYAIGDYPYILGAGMLPNGENLKDSVLTDQLGDGLGLVWSDQQGNVDLWYARPEAADRFAMVADWYNKGYVFPDSPYNTIGGDALMLQGTVAGNVVASEIGVEVSKTSACGTDVVAYTLVNGYLTTSSGRNWGSFIPVTASEPEAALRFLNLLFTNAELNNLLTWGIEDESYIVNDAGEAGYPAGMDASSAGYHGMDYSLGNQFLCLPWEGQGGDFRAIAEDDFKNAPRSVYMGLSVDTAGFETQLSALSAVRDEYSYIIANGLYTESLYQEFLDKLASAGVDEYIGLYRNAVEEFMK